MEAERVMRRKLIDDEQRRIEDSVMCLIRRRIENDEKRSSNDSEKRSDDVESASKDDGPTLNDVDERTADVEIASDSLISVNNNSDVVNSESSVSSDNETLSIGHHSDNSDHCERDSSVNGEQQPSYFNPEPERDDDTKCQNNFGEDDKRSTFEKTDVGTGGGDTVVAVRPYGGSNEPGLQLELDDIFFTDNSSMDSFVTADSSERSYQDEITVASSANGRWNACCIL